ncbi:ATP-binding protein [Kitasatospora sp. NPDC089913]|uniref:ATP-binding protein n=1 Tax=Kitasatospora sp. NPDC089913 TaxID=3364080 RepID=UPI003809011F
MQDTDRLEGLPAGRPYDHRTGLEYRSDPLGTAAAGSAAVSGKSRCPSTRGPGSAADGPVAVPGAGPAGAVLRGRIGRGDLARIAEVRAELRDALRRWGVAELIDTAELLSSELVTNAIRHTDRDAMFTARLYREPAAAGGRARLRVEVEDESDLRPTRRTPGEQASSGRGLMLVEALADGWGVEPRGSGKRVWFELTTPGPAPRPVPAGST